MPSNMSPPRTTRHCRQERAEFNLTNYRTAYVSFNAAVAARGWCVGLWTPCDRSNNRRGRTSTATRARLTREEDLEMWLSAPWPEVVRLQRPLPDGSLWIVAMARRTRRLRRRRHRDLAAVLPLARRRRRGRASCLADVAGAARVNSEGHTDG